MEILIKKILVELASDRSELHKKIEYIEIKYSKNDY
jgi:hypothetical protein